MQMLEAFSWASPLQSTLLIREVWVRQECSLAFSRKATPVLWVRRENRLVDQSSLMVGLESYRCRLREDYLGRPLSPLIDDYHQPQDLT